MDDVADVELCLVCDVDRSVVVAAVAEAAAAEVQPESAANEEQC